MQKDLSSLSILFKTATIDSFGPDFGRMFDSYVYAGVIYNYENTKSGFWFTFFRPHGHRNVHEMSKMQKAVYEIIKSNNRVTAKMISNSIGKSKKLCIEQSLL